MNKIFTKNLPEQFTRLILQTCGREGEIWLDNLPETIKRIERNWDLEVKRTFSNLSYNFVATGILAKKKAVVLKIGLPQEEPEIFKEAYFLEMLNGKGAVRILKTDRENRAILLERLIPGKDLKETFLENKQKAVDIAIEVMKKIHRKPSKKIKLPHLKSWFEGFENAPGTDFPKVYLGKTKWVFDELATKEKILLHGDLHHENILSAEREEFLAIDPKGIIGNVEYEIAVFLNNHRKWVGHPDILENAVSKFSGAFNISSADLKKWAYAQQVLSAWWSFEDGIDSWKKDLAFADFWKV